MNFVEWIARAACAMAIGAVGTRLNPPVRGAVRISICLKIFKVICIPICAPPSNEFWKLSCLTNFLAEGHLLLNHITYLIE